MSKKEENSQEISRKSTRLKSSFKKSLLRLIDDEVDLNSNFISLVSQTKNQINVEIILDDNIKMHKTLHKTGSHDSSINYVKLEEDVKS